MTTYTVALSKGGSTKTTTAAELVTALASRGRRVLAIDLDQQGNLSTRLGLTAHTDVGGVAADVLVGTIDAVDAATPSPAVDGVDVLAGTHDLANMDQQPEVITALRDCLPSLHEWDDVVIDTPPALGLVTLAGLAAADVVIAAVACETEAYDQLARLADVIRARIARRLKRGQRIHWVVPTRHDPRRLLDRDVVAQLNADWPGQVTNPIREAVAARDAFTAGLPVSVYAPNAPITADYRSATATIIDTHQEHQ